jgi:hypothetical protein
MVYHYSTNLHILPLHILHETWSGKVFSLQYLPIIVTIFVAAEITIRLTKDIYKTRKINETRLRLLKLNWIIPTQNRRFNNKLFHIKYVLLPYLLDSYSSMILSRIQNPQTKISIKSVGAVIFIVVLVIVLTGVVLKISST